VNADAFVVSFIESEILDLPYPFVTDFSKH
jgi:hypothetical protein